MIAVYLDKHVGATYMRGRHPRQAGSPKLYVAIAPAWLAGMT